MSDEPRGPIQDINLPAYLKKRLSMSEQELKWEEEATEMLGKVPGFVRRMVKGKIEKAAKAAGEETITVAFMEKVKSEQG